MNEICSIIVIIDKLPQSKLQPLVDDLVVFRNLVYLLTPIHT